MEPLFQSWWRFQHGKCCEFHSMGPMIPNRHFPPMYLSNRTPPSHCLPALNGASAGYDTYLWSWHPSPSSLKIQLSSVISRSFQLQRIHGLKYPSLQAYNLYFPASQGGTNIKRSKKTDPPRIEMCPLRNQRACLKISTNSAPSPLYFISSIKEPHSSHDATKISFPTKKKKKKKVLSLLGTYTSQSFSQVLKTTIGIIGYKFYANGF